MPKRIALVTPMLPVAHDLTRGRYIFETAAALAKLATVRVFFQTSRYPGPAWARPRSYLYADNHVPHGVEGLDVETSTYPAFPVVSRALNGRVSARSLLPGIRAFAPDLVLGYWLYPDGYAAARCARALGVPSVIGALGSDIHERPGRAAIAQTRATIAMADALLTVSEAMRGAAIRQFGADPARTHTIVNGFNGAVFHPRDRGAARRELGVAADERLIVYVGRLVEAKGMNELIAAMARLSAVPGASYRLALVGDGVMREQLVAKVAASGLGAQIRFVGGCEPPQVAQWIAASDVLTLPSWSEGYPNVVVEAIACGRPVVATDVGGTCEIVNPRNGILIPPRDASALADALISATTRSVAGDWDETGMARAIARSWDDVAVETFAVCERLIEAKAGACAATGSRPPRSAG